MFAQRLTLALPPAGCCCAGVKAVPAHAAAVSTPRPVDTYASSTKQRLTAAGVPACCAHPHTAVLCFVAQTGCADAAQCSCPGSAVEQATAAGPSGCPSWCVPGAPRGGVALARLVGPRPRFLCGPADASAARETASCWADQVSRCAAHIVCDSLQGAHGAAAAAAVPT